MPDCIGPQPTAAAAEAGLPPPLKLLLAVSAGASVANLYYAQPILRLIANSFGVSGGIAAQVSTATQVGYAAGMILLVPLGDAIDRRQLVLWQVWLLMGAMALAAVAPSLWVLLAASALVGFAATIAQHLIPIAAELASPETRGRDVGVVMSGLLSGILVARTLSGVVGAAAGWRTMFGLGALIAAGMAIALWGMLPPQTPRNAPSYGTLMLSLHHVVRRFPELRRAALVQGLIFACFSAFWSTLTLLLASPRYNLGPVYAGLFGVVGLVGVGAAPVAGALSDRRGPDGVTRIGIAMVAVALVLLGLVPGIVPLVVGVVLLDGGTQISMVSQQWIVLALDDTARGRINTLYVTGIFIGGALGSIGASVGWEYGGWPGVCGFCVTLALIAFAVHWSLRPRRAIGTA